MTPEAGLFAVTPTHFGHVCRVGRHISNALVASHPPSSSFRASSVLRELEAKLDKEQRVDIPFAKTILQTMPSVEQRKAVGQVRRPSTKYYHVMTKALTTM
jgi:hypothetical protein